MNQPDKTEKLNKSVLIKMGSIILISYESYRPLSLDEGDEFTERWCGACQRLYNGCGIPARAVAHDIDSKYYPAEWHYGVTGIPMCKLYVEIGQDIPTPRCTKT